MKNIQITDSTLCASVFKSIWDNSKIERQEQAYVLYMNKKGEVIDHELLSSGGYSSLVLDVRTLYYNAIGKNAHSVAIAHNHPDGTIQPSKKDIEVTKSIKTVLAEMEIHLVDHIIITKESYYSLADNKLLN